MEEEVFERQRLHEIKVRNTSLKTKQITKNDEFDATNDGFDAENDGFCS